MSQDLPGLLAAALTRRRDLLAALHAEETDCYRLFHGAVEGRAGLTVDRYGALGLVQTFRAPLADGELEQIAAAVEPALGRPLEWTWNHRGRAEDNRGAKTRARERRDAIEPTPPRDARELGVIYQIRARHRGLDPHLFLDLRAGRRWVKANSRGADVLNLFAYTCGLGLAAGVGGAREVWNVDFARSALDVGRENALANRLDDPARFQLVQADVLPTIRQLAGLPIRGRGARRRYQRFQARRFDLVILDPPTWATSPFGAVDPVRDYPSLFKPALLACRGAVLATNHVSTVRLDDWLDQLRRCAEKAGRPLAALEVIQPEADFPSPDGRHPLKIAVATIRQ